MDKQQPNRVAESDVLVVGAGPTGMTVAALLAARGVRVLVLEQREGTSEEPKAISIDDEALRTYQQAGIVEDILGIIVPGTGTRYYDADNQPLFQARAAAPYRLGYPFKNPFAQPDLERVLEDSLLRNDVVDLRFGVRVTGVDEDADRAYVTAEGPQGVERFSARYVLGADGGRSIVRKLFGNEMTGRSYSEVWLVADTLEDPHTERYGMHHGDPVRPHVIVPGLDGRCRYEFRLFEGESETGVAPAFELIRKLVAPYRDLEPRHVERAVNYRFNAVNADRWREGRFFLLGDAAHMMPFAGQGLNSGIRDAANLAWKVAEVVAGKAPDTILDSYETERKPHAAAIIAQSVRLGSVVMTTSPRVAERRDEPDRRNKSYRLQVARVWIGGAGLVVALFRAVFDLWSVVAETRGLPARDHTWFGRQGHCATCKGRVRRRRPRRDPIRKTCPTGTRVLDSQLLRLCCTHSSKAPSVRRTSCPESTTPGGGF